MLLAVVLVVAEAVREVTKEFADLAAARVAEVQVYLQVKVLQVVRIL